MIPGKVELLSSSHDRKSFDCGEKSLNDYLHRFARQNDQKGIGKTYVFVPPDSKQIAGYYTLSSYSVIQENMPESLSKSLPKYPVPVALLARLAVDNKFQGKQLGSALLFDALERVLKLSMEIAIFGVMVHALHEKAKAFYLKYGFVELKHDPLHLILPLATIRELVQ